MRTIPPMMSAGSPSGSNGQTGNWPAAIQAGVDPMIRVSQDDHASYERRVGANDARELEQLRRLTGLILESTTDSICGVDARGVVNFVNPAALTTLGYTRPSSVVGRMLHDVLHGPVCCAAATSNCASLVDPRVTVRSARQEIGRPDGSRSVIEYSTAPMYDDGQLRGCVFTFRDITERRAVERIKDEIISVVSHELRTPLTSIRASLGLLRSPGMLAPMSPRAERLLEISMSNTERLVKLINDVLDLERMESGLMELDRHPCTVGEIMTKACAVVQPQMDDRGIAVHVVMGDADESILADCDRIVQVVINLLGNALKFSAPGSAIYVSESRIPDTDLVEFVVRDEGRGVAPDDLDRIFERFQQVNSSDSRDKGGTGLGLAICRTIVKQHGGRIWAESQMGKGSSFHFTLSAGANIAILVPASDPRRRMIVVCDDEVSVRSVASQILKFNGFSVVTASSGAELLEVVSTMRPDAVLIDMMMPDINGWQVLATLRATPGMQDVPIVVLSGLDPEQGEVESLQVSQWLRKPFRASELTAAVNSAIEGTPAR